MFAGIKHIDIFVSYKNHFNMIREIIKTRLLEKRMKAIELSNLVGVSRSSMSLFLSGKIGVRTDKLEKMFEVLDISLTVKD